MLALSELKKEFLSLLEAVLDGFDRLLRKILILDYELVQVVAEKVSTDMSSMAVINAEEGALGPLGTTVLLRFGFHYIQNDGNSVLIVVPYNALVRIGTVGGNNTVSLGAELSGLVVRHQLFDVIDGARAHFLPHTLVEVFPYHRLRVGTIVVTLGALYSILNQTR